MKKALPLSIVGCDTPKSILTRLSELGFEVCVLERDTRLPQFTASHADMILLRIKNTFFCSNEYFNAYPNVFSRIKEYGYDIITMDSEISDIYPNDIPLNLAFVGKYLFGKLDCTSDIIKIFSEKNKIIPIPIKQGYAKCSTVILGSSAIITADPSIADAALKNGIDVLKIQNSPSAVSLKGYDYGFIGGACGVYQKKVYFTGDIRKHPNCADILKFCQKHGFESISLDDGMLVDVGGIIFAEPLS